MVTLKGGQEAHRVDERTSPSRSQAFATGQLVAELSDQWGCPTVRAVADAIGLSPNATYKRLLAAVDAGWLWHREGRAQAFAPTAALLERIK